METTKSIIERHTVEVEPGVKKLDLVSIILELDARVKTTYSVIDEIKQCIQGYAVWAKETDERLQKVDPKILLKGDKGFDETIKGL